MTREGRGAAPGARRLFVHRHQGERVDWALPNVLVKLGVDPVHFGMILLATVVSG